MKIGNLYFANSVFGQAGVQGFFGEPGEHPLHKFLKRMFKGFSFSGMVLVAKTVTLPSRIYPISNTELRDGYKVKRYFPKSVWWSFSSFLKGYVLNAVGLANQGLLITLRRFKWQNRKDPFQISIALSSKTLKEEIIEVKYICKLLLLYLPLSTHKYAIQLDLSCPTFRHEKQNIYEMTYILSMFKKAIPQLVIIPKFDFTVEPETIMALKPYCDAFCVGNSLYFGELMDKEWWKELFPKGSPLLKHFGGKFPGGLSGAPLFPLLVEWLEKMEAVDDSVVIIAGGGIMTKENILRLSKFKIVRGVALGVVANLRPWRLQSLIRYGNEVFKKRKNF